METITASKENLNAILKALKGGQVLVFPTDTVYGLICDSTSAEAVERIFKIKKREKTKPLAVFVKDIKAAKGIAYINKEQEAFLKNNWPGPVTVVLKAKEGLAKSVYKEETIGVRIPNYKLLNLVLEKFKKPIAQTSANISGQPATTKIKKVLEQFSDSKSSPDLLVTAGDIVGGQPSKVFVYTDVLQRVR